MAKKCKKKTSDAAAQAAENTEKTVAKATAKQPAKKKTAKAKPLVRGKVVAHDVKGLRKHTVKKTGEEIRFKARKHPEKAGHHIQVHGKVVEEGVRLVTPAAQSSIVASLRAAGHVPPQSEIAFLGPRDF